MFVIAIYSNTKSTQNNLSRSKKGQRAFDEDQTLKKNKRRS